MRLKFQEVLIKPTEIATVNTGPFVLFGGFTYIPLQTTSDFDWIFQVISRYILLQENHCFIEWAWNQNSNPGLWTAVQKANKQSGGKGLSPPPKQQPGLAAQLFWQKQKSVPARAHTQGWLGRLRPCLDTSIHGTWGGGGTEGGWWFARESRGSSPSHQPFWACCLPAIGPPGKKTERVQQPRFCTQPPGQCQWMAHTGTDSHLSAGWAEAEILKGQDMRELYFKQLG